MPVRSASVEAAANRRAGSPPGATKANSAAVRMASVVVLLVLKGRDDPNKAYTNMGRSATYRPASTGKPAIIAKAMDLGMTTAAVVRPATTSARNQLKLYALNEATIGKNVHFFFIFAVLQHFGCSRKPETFYPQQIVQTGQPRDEFLDQPRNGKLQ